MTTLRFSLAMVLLACTVTTMGAMSGASESSDAHRLGAWETVVQSVRKSNTPSLAEMNVQIPHAGSIRVRYSNLSGASGLVLVMCGTFSKAENPFTDDLAGDFMQAGYNVVTVDSFFSTRFVSQSHIGSPGNLRREAMLAGDLLDAKVEYIFARNDPLNIDGAADDLQKIKTAAKVTVLPNGGHAGFVRTPQTQVIMHRVFTQSMASGVVRPE